MVKRITEKLEELEETNPWSFGCSLSIFRDAYIGLELCSFRALLFCLVFDCGVGCMNLSLLVKVSVLLKLQSIAFFYKVDCPLFFRHGVRHLRLAMQSQLVRKL